MEVFDTRQLKVCYRRKKRTLRTVKIKQNSFERQQKRKKLRLKEATFRMNKKLQLTMF